MSPREQVRLECLKLACTRTTGVPQILEYAKSFEDYVLETKPEAAPEVDSKKANAKKNPQKAANLDPLS